MPARTRAEAPTGHSRRHSFPALRGGRSGRSVVVRLRTRNRVQGARTAAVMPEGAVMVAGGRLNPDRCEPGAAEAGNRLSHG